MTKIITQDWFDRNKFYLVIFLCAFAVRLVLFSVNFTHNDFDLIKTIHGDDGYYELSQSILGGEGVAKNPLRPPLWPAIIAFTAYFLGYWGGISSRTDYG